MKKALFKTLLCCVAIVSIERHAVAVTMISSDFESLCAKAEVRLYAQVTRQERLPPQGDILLPRMCYELKVLEQLGGQPLAGNARICYLGDTESPTRKIVAGLRYPVVGETGIFLIHVLNDSTVISPLEGYNQGHFSVQISQGRRSVLAANGKAICGFDASRKSGSLDGDAADGLLLDSKNSRCEPMPFEAFKRKVSQCPR